MSKAGRGSGSQGEDKPAKKTARREAQIKASFAELEERYRSLVENINDVLYTLDDQGNITYVSPVVERFTKYRVADLEGRPFAPLVHPDDLPGLLESFNRLMSGHLEPWEFRVLDKDGRIIHVRSSSRPIYREGKIVGATALVTDISAQKQAEAALKESERLYRLVTDNATDIIWTSDMDLNTTYISPSVTAVRGFTVEEVMHQSPEQRYTQESLKIIRQIYQTALSKESEGKMQSGHIELFEAEHIRKDGTAVWMETQASFIRDENGKAIGIIGVSRDISQRKAAQAAINKQREEYRTIFDSVPEIIAYINREGRFIRINRVAAAALGLTPKAAIGKKLHDVFPAAEADRFLTGSRKAMDEGQPSLNIISQTTLPAGKMIWTNTSIIPYIDESGQVIGSINVVQNISERVLAEQALLRSEERFRNTASLLPQTIFETDEKANFTFVNRQGYETFGYSEDDVARGMSVLQTIIPEDHARAIENIGRRIRGEVLPANEYTAVRKDGGTFPIMIFANPIIQDGKYAGMRGILVDITERKQLEKSLEQSVEKLNKALQEIIYTMSTIVELKDPYTAGHQRRVAQLATAIARELRLPQDQIDFINTAAIIHDIGKLYVPTDIMSKPGKLTTLEYNLIRTHAQSSYDILKTIDFPWPIAKIVWQHHERMDGSGYPNKVKGDDILPEARILMVADQVEAMASHRPHRPAMKTEDALKEITDNRGILYPAEVVDACLAIFSRGDFKFA